MAMTIERLERILRSEIARIDAALARQFHYFETKFAHLEARLDTMATKADIERILNMFDRMVARQDGITVEQAVMERIA